MNNKASFLFKNNTQTTKIFWFDLSSQVFFVHIWVFIKENFLRGKHFVFKSWSTLTLLWKFGSTVNNSMILCLRIVCNSVIYWFCGQVISLVACIKDVLVNLELWSTSSHMSRHYYLFKFWIFFCESRLCGSTFSNFKNII